MLVWSALDSAVEVVVVGRGDATVDRARGAWVEGEGGEGKSSIFRFVITVEGLPDPTGGDAFETIFLGSCIIFY